MENSDNVIRFPDRSDAREQAAELAADLLRQGQDPAAVVAQLLELGGRRAAELIPTPTQPTLPPAPETPRRYRVRVDLDGARPPIWRRLELAGDLTLAELHEILQTAMGWTDSHLHHFVAGAKRDGSVAPFVTDFDEAEGDEGVNERDVRLDQVLVEIGDRLGYEYDFGDGWEHSVVLEDVHEYDDSAPRARVLGGRRACPPEDCGGIPGYEALLEATANRHRASEDQRELLDWLGDEWHPDDFSPEQTDDLLQVTLAGFAGSVGVEAALVRAGSGLSPALQDLVKRSAREPQALNRLLAAAGLTVLDEPDAAAKAAMVRPWQHLLRVLGDGIRLTPAGWLPPAVVTRLGSELDLHEPWMGKGNREEHMRPVARIRETAAALGLVRKRKGELLPTTLGRRLAGDPEVPDLPTAEALWRHVVEALPMGRRQVDRNAGTVMLLAVAAGATPYDGIRIHGPGLLWSAGWADPAGGPPSGSDAVELARPTWDVLGVLGCSPTVLDEIVTEEIRQLARAALRVS